MGRVRVAFRLFFRALGDAGFAAQGERLLEGNLLQAPRAAPPVTAPAPARPEPARKTPARSEALNLLAVLQREGRLVDFLKEDLSAYSDAQIGAAVRDVHRDSAAALERIFALRPVRTETEGASVEIPAGFDAGRIRLTGNITGQGPYRGALRHAGWEATRVQVPEWSGSAAAASVVAPAEIEI